jgi:hypothetical protein
MAPAGLYRARHEAAGALRAADRLPRAGWVDGVVRNDADATAVGLGDVTPKPEPSAYSAVIALAAVVTILLALLILARRIIKARRLRRDAEAVGAAADPFDLRSWGPESATPGANVDRTARGVRGESVDVPRLSLGSRVLATLCIADEDIERNSVCPICLHPLTRKCRQAACGHQYHAACIKSWLAKVSAWQCPLCPSGRKSGAAGKAGKAEVDFV